MKRYRNLLLAICLISMSRTVVAQQHSFNSYNVPLYKGHPAKLKLKGNALAEQYRTAIRTTYYSTKDQVAYHGSTGLNFGGHYCFVYWGCGSDCQYAVVVDLKTGIVYPGTDAERGYKFQPNSRLIIVNPDPEPTTTTYKEEYWVWNEAGKKFTKLR
ncbi:hypothetical protein SAMN05216490_0735 [Mucilaginibacter mallensis]|uniref:Uncharacterized protein n=2 Tax=Mucilaginibacter mallensis TaxID=652787 RepID=A0A1H1QBS1_MUCMA|nr:hypothetical protein SAMN05216490_0735 [Mucilaginibacter mallensis]